MTRSNVTIRIMNDNIIARTDFTTPSTANSFDDVAKLQSGAPIRATLIISDDVNRDAARFHTHTDHATAFTGHQHSRAMQSYVLAVVELSVCPSVTRSHAS